MFPTDMDYQWGAFLCFLLFQKLFYRVVNDRVNCGNADREERDEDFYENISCGIDYFSVTEQLCGNDLHDAVCELVMIEQIKLNEHDHTVVDAKDPDAVPACPDEDLSKDGDLVDKSGNRQNTDRTAEGDAERSQNAIPRFRLNIRHNARLGRTGEEVIHNI